MCHCNVKNRSSRQIIIRHVEPYDGITGNDHFEPKIRTGPNGCVHAVTSNRTRYNDCPNAVFPQIFFHFCGRKGRRCAFDENGIVSKRLEGWHGLLRRASFVHRRCRVQLVMVNMDHLFTGIPEFFSEVGDLGGGIAVHVVTPGVEAVLDEHLHIYDNKSFFQNCDPVRLSELWRCLPLVATPAKGHL
ncbi:hypothetical protein SAMN03159496_05831 [Rhizobium sp. NFR07]|nr:hypothetical protein SAMN03159496_05831 [Rhizobium sp. NFR07]